MFLLKNNMLQLQSLSKLTCQQEGVALRRDSQLGGGLPEPLL